MSRARFPPRADLPATMIVEQVPLLGTTWYERGAAYWLRRVGLVLMMAMVIAIVTALLWGFFGGIRDSSVTGFWIALSIEIAYSAGVVVWLMIRLGRRWNDLGPAPTRAAIRAGATGGAIGTLARAGSTLGAAVLVLGSLLFVGVYVGLLLFLLMPETIWERKARLDMAEHLRARGIPVST